MQKQAPMAQEHAPHTPMNVVFEADAITTPLTGVGRYAWEVATQLKQHREISSVRFFARGGWRELESLYQPDAVVVKQQRPLVARLRKMPLVGKLHLLLKSWRSAWRLRDVQADIFHSPAFFLPRLRIPTVVTVHDLSVYMDANWHPQGRVKVIRSLIERAVARADLILTDAHSVREEILARFAIDPARVEAVHLGVDTAYRPHRAEEISSVLAEYGLRYGGYTLFISTIEPRKNILRLIEAYRALPHDVRMQYPLVLAGAPGWNSEEIHEAIRAAKSEGWLHYHGYVRQPHIPALYAGSRLFAYPSLYEGFGLPVAEAMASGVPVLTSSCSSMPEVAGGAALLVEPTDTASITAGLQQALTDDAWRAEAITRGLARAKELSWERCAQQTIALYRKAQQLAAGKR
jgi:glycosyltransferase involved in cell wall biosynthesis